MKDINLSNKVPLDRHLPGKNLQC